MYLGCKKMTVAESSNRLIVALDFPSSQHALTFVEPLEPSLCRIKVGKELFTSEGPKLVEALVNKGFDVFLDLKFHDIPNTVKGAVKAAADLGVWMVNVHASGGEPMMVAAREALDMNHSCGTKLIAVTVLTSMDLFNLQQVVPWVTSLNEYVLILAKLAKKSGLDGVVCSAQESNLIKESLGSQFMTVTPGIRLSHSSLQHDDQSRVVTPIAAIKNGSDYIVMGRSITGADHPLLVIREINQQISCSE